MKVEINRMKKGGSQEVVATFELVEGNVVGSGKQKFVDRFSEQGVLDKSVKPPRKVLPSDGVIFMKSLVENLNSGYLIATEVFGEKAPQ